MAGLFSFGFALFVLFVAQCFAQTPAKPHIIFVMTDDMGIAAAKWAADLLWEQGTDCKNNTFERDPKYTPTPNLNDLAIKKGIILQNYYAYTSCTPSRMALMSGRLPIEVGVILGEPEQWDGGSDSTWGMDGMPTNLTIFPALLQQRGYATHMVGKGDGFGTVTPLHLPINRGFNSTLHYHSHANDMFDYSIGPLSVGLPPPCKDAPWNAPFVADLWQDNGPAPKNGGYEEKVFSKRVLDIIAAHNPAKPLFVYYSPHIPHTPLQLPHDGDSNARDWYGETAQQMCEFNSECRRPDGTCWLNCTGFEGIIPQTKWYACLNSSSRGSPRGVCASVDRVQYLASLRYIDEVVKNITNALEAKGMWNDTLLVFTSDNGGGIGLGPGGSNYPLRGGKGGFWEGGFRVPTFISGGFIPEHRQGTIYKPVMHISDWYRTLVQQGDGSHVNDTRGDAAHIVPPQPYDYWTSIATGAATEVRSNLHLSPGAYLEHRNGRWMKILQGNISNNLWQGPDFPNSTCDTQMEVDLFQCRTGNPTPIGIPTNTYLCGPHDCLFDITNDPGEHTPVNDATIRSSMIATLNTLNQHYREPWRGCKQERLWCDAATKYWNSTFGATYGPFVNVAGCPDTTCVHLTAAYWAHPTVPKTLSINDCPQNLPESD